MNLRRAEKCAYYLALALTVYMPLHIFLSQSLSSVTGGLEAWKAAKDIVVCVAVPFLLFLAYKQGAFKTKFFRRFALLGGLYVLLYVLFLLFDKNADTKSAITGSVYNMRPLGYLLLGYVVAGSKEGKTYAKSILKTLLIMCTIVASFGVLQYFLPKDLLTHFGYSLERGVKPFFFIDDKPDFPRVMSTLRDPNSLGAFLVFPIVYASYFLFIKKGKQVWKLFSDRWLQALLALSALCLLFTFSRSGVVATFVALATMIFVGIGNKRALFKKFLPLLAVGFIVPTSLFFVFKNTYVIKNLVLHSDESSAQLDPNELRLSFGGKAVEHIKKYPLGEGPGTAGLVAISNPKGGVLTENYYLQIAYEVGVVGMVLFVSIYLLLLKTLYIKQGTEVATVLFCTGCGLALFSLLNHSWSNEALALTWWLPVGAALGASRDLGRVRVHK